MHPNFQIHLVVAGLATALLAADATARPQSIELISRASSGGASSGACYGAPFVSADGRWVAFASTAEDLVPSNASGDVFVLDRASGLLTLASPDLGGLPGTSTATLGGLSGDGRYVVYQGDQFGPWDEFDHGSDVLVRDLAAATTTEVTNVEFQAVSHSRPRISDDGGARAHHTTNDWFGARITSIVVRDENHVVLGSRQGNASFGGTQPGDTWVEQPHLSGDGRYLVYQHRTPSGTAVRRYGYAVLGSPEDVVATSSAAEGAVDAAGVSRDGRFVVFTRRVGLEHATWVRDLATNTEERVDPTSGAALAAASVVGGISDDGRFVVFSNPSPDLVAGDTNGVADVFVRDRLHQLTARVSVDANGAQANGASVFSAIDAAGSAVVFASSASNLVPLDTNGAVDVFRRTMCASSFTDADGDGFGGAAWFTCDPHPPGNVAAGGDCDDADPARNPGALELCNGVDDDCDAFVDEDLAGAPFCFGDGSGIACPCGNAGAAGRGCASSVDPSGALLRTLGCASLAADTLVLSGSGMSNSQALYFQGDAQAGGGAGVLFGDGLRCVAGALTRLGARPNVAGASAYPGPGDASVSARGGVTAPATRHYQAWYRNAAAFCTSATFNLTNGMAVAWQL